MNPMDRQESVQGEEVQSKGISYGLERRRVGGVAWLIRSLLSDDLLAAVPGLFAGEVPPPGTKPITWGRSKKAVIWDDRFIVKKYSYPSFFRQLIHLMVPLPAELEIRKAVRVASLSIPTVVPQAAGTEYRGPLPVCSYVIIENLPGARDLEAFFRSRPAAAERRSVILKLARLTREVHAHSIYQYDYNPSNFLLDPGGSLLFIDMGKVFFCERVTRSQVVENLARLLRAARRLGLPATDSIRFFREYLGRRGRLSAGDRALAARIAERCRSLRVERERKIGSACMKTGRQFYTLASTRAEAHVAMGGWGERRLRVEELDAAVEAIGRGGPPTFAGRSDLQVEMIARRRAAVAAWRRANVEYFSGRSGNRPMALILTAGGNYIITSPREEA